MRITLTSPCNVNPLASHFYIVKLGFTGVYIIFLIFALKHRLWVLVRTASVSKNLKKEKKKKTENCHFYSREISLYIARECLRNGKCITLL